MTYNVVTDQGRLWQHLQDVLLYVVRLHDFFSPALTSLLPVSVASMLDSRESNSEETAEGNSRSHGLQVCFLDSNKIAFAVLAVVCCCHERERDTGGRIGRTDVAQTAAAT